MDQQRGRPVLVEFWDFCRVNSLRTLPYLQAWHERYAAAGLRVIGVHTGGFPPSREPDNVRAAVERLGIAYPVVIDERLEVWDLYGNEGWPARYLWDPSSALYSLHYGEGAYDETEREIQELLGVERELLAPLRPEDAPGVLLPPRRPTTSRAPTRAPTRPAACTRWWRARASWRSTAGRRRRRARLLPARRARAPHRGRPRARDRPRRDVPRHLLHAGAGGAPRGPVRQQPDEPRRPAVLDQDRGARPVGRRDAAPG